MTCARRLPSGAAALVCVLLSVAPASAQTIRGVVVDGETGDPISLAAVAVWDDGGRAVGSVGSALDGRFAVPVGATGTYILQIERLGYVTVGPTAVTIGEGEALSVRVELALSPIVLDPIVASGAFELRNEGSVAGALARRELFPDVGSRRVVVPSDVEMVNSMDVNRVLQWFPPPRGCGAQTDLAQLGSQDCGCTIVHWNGLVVHEFDAVAFYLSLNPSSLAAVEYYKYWIDAPMDLKGVPAWLKPPDPYSCAVVALWPRRSG